MPTSDLQPRLGLFEPRDQTVRLLIVCLPLGFVLVSGILLALILLLFRTESIASGERLMRSIAGVIEEQTTRTIQNVDQTLEAARQKLAELGDVDLAKEQPARAILRGQLVDRPFIRAIWVLDATGRIVYDSDVGNVGRSVADRPYFKVYQDQPTTGFEITAPFISRSTGEWAVAATRPWRRADGTLLGVVVGALELKFLDRVWNIGSGEEIAITLLHRNGTLLMRSPFSEKVMGRSFAESPLFTKLLTAAPAGVYQNVSVADSQWRILAYRTLSAYPNLVIVAGQTLERVLAPWHRYATFAVAGWLLACVVLTLLSIWLFGEWKRRQATESRYRELFDANPHPTFLVDPETMQLLAVNDAAIKHYGWSRDEFMSMNLADLGAPPAASAPGRADDDLPGSPAGHAARHRTKSGTPIDVDITTRRIAFGGLQAELTVVEDVTAQNEARRVHRASEAQLRQAQKMEAVGQLTGGVAHDFNNMLTVIIGNAETIYEGLPGDSPLRPICDQVLKAAEGSAALTHRLLAFSRQQPLQPRRTDITRKVSDMDALLRRTLGEHIDIRLVASPDIWSVIIDPVQLESAILNLAINARDAMPAGGRLTIEISNVQLDGDYVATDPDAVAGDFVLVAVSDSGAGMTPEVMLRAFDPFFTTKEVGKGSGLGLSMVYGFVRQSGGHVKIYSEVGHGSSIKMYLPRATGGAEHEKPVEAAPRAMPPDSASILVVEDDSMVRNHVAAQLTRMGYRVAVADSGQAALAVLADNKFDLLFTDIVMPGGMTGRDLAAEAIKRFPEMKILLTSGYTQNAFQHQGELGGLHLLSKPYRQHELAAKLREVLEARTAATSST
jgi:PAS domain S-box-containing protein